MSPLLVKLCNVLIGGMVMRKRAFTLLLTIAMMFSSLFSTYAYASEGGMKAKRSYSEFTITIVSYTPKSGASGTSSGFGHSFILLHNNSSIPVTVGHMYVPAGDYVSVGIFDKEHAPNKDHAGVWYNREAWSMSLVKQQNYIAISYDLTDRQVAILSDYINSNDRYVFPTYTCSTFAVGCWNKVVPSAYQIVASTMDPLTLVNYISGLGLPDATLPSKDKAKSTIAYQTPTGVAYDSGTLSVLALPF